MSTATATPARSATLATALLVGITAVWGSTFFLIKDVVRQLSPADFLAVRFVIAAALMSVVFWRPLRALTRRQVRVGVVLGVLYAVAQLLQTVGLAHTEASRSGFITGTYVVLTPVLTAVLLRERLPRSTWAAVGLASVGLARPVAAGARHGLRRDGDLRVGASSTPCTSSAWAAGPPRPRRRGSRRCR